jgi:glycosyltransferase involved in cell wall biosynthesis
VVIPVINEAPNVPEVLGRVPGTVWEILVVDGGSRDGTASVVAEVCPEARVIAQSSTGKGNALACGFRAAGGEIIVMLDGDGSTDPAEIPRFVRALVEGADFAKGSRFVPGGGSADITAVRRVGNWLFVRLANALYGTAYTDLCYGYNAFWADVRDYLRIEHEGFEVEALINVQIAKAGLRVREVASFEHRRLHGMSNLRPVPDGLRILGILMAERLQFTSRRSAPATRSQAALGSRAAR